MDFFGASSAMIGALVPVKDAGSLLPQLAVSGKMRSFSIRKNFWAISALIQGLCWLAAAGHIFLGDEKTFPMAMLVLLAVFSVASGVASVAYKDVVGKTIPKNTRGKMLSYRSTFGGILSLIAGVVLVFFIQEEADISIYGFMFLFAASLWFVASILFFMIKEEKGATKGGRNPLQEVKAGLKLIKKETNFRNFLFTRALLMAIPLLQPFYVLVAKDIDDTTWSLLGYLIIVNGLANIISSPFWGKIADQSSTRLMRISSMIAIGGGVFALLFYFASDWNLGFYAFLPVFFINGIAYSGARLSRKTYLVDYAPDDDRPTYVSVANTFIGLFTLLAAGFGVVAELFGLPAQIIFFMSLLVLAIVLSFRLKKV
jgi:MFS family permease